MAEDRRIYDEKDFQLMLKAIDERNNKRHSKKYIEFIQRNTEACLLITGLTEVAKDFKFDDSYLEKFDVNFLDFDVDSFLEELKISANSEYADSLVKKLDITFKSFCEFYESLDLLEFNTITLLYPSIVKTSL